MLILSLLMTSLVANAGNFTLATSCSKSIGPVGYCIITNYLENEILCEGSVMGRTRSGDLQTEDVDRLVLKPEEFIMVSIYSDNYNPFQMVSSSIECIEIE